MTALILPEPLRNRLLDEARAAYPRECCGLLEGLRDDGAIRVTALHPAPNIAPRDDRFEIDPVVQFHVMRRLRGGAHAVVGCYHSHPDGSARPSDADGEGASEEGAVWLIQPLEEARAGAPAAFIFERGTFRSLPLTS